MYFCLQFAYSFKELSVDLEAYNLMHKTFVIDMKGNHDCMHESFEKFIEKLF